MTNEHLTRELNETRRAAESTVDRIPYGLTAADRETLMRLACAAADEYRLRLTRDLPDSAYLAALMSFSDPDHVHELAIQAWSVITEH